MRTARIGFLCACAALLIPACGGGTDATIQTSALQGLVYEVDGQATDLSGVAVTVVETGDTVTTGYDGSFVFPDMPAGRYTLEFDTTANFAAQTAGNMLEGEGESSGDAEGGAGSEENGGDGYESDGAQEEERERNEGDDAQGRPVVEIQETCDGVVVRVALANGEVKEFTISEHEDRHARAELHRTDFTPDRVEGVIKVTAKTERELFKVDIFHLEPGSVVELFLDDRSGEGPRSIGTAIADGAGEATYLRDTQSGQVLPLDAENLDALAGMRLEVRFFETELTILIGEIPDLPEANEHHCDNEPGASEGDGENTGEGDGEASGDGENTGEGDGEASGDGESTGEGDGETSGDGESTAETGGDGGESNV